MASPEIRRFAQQLVELRETLERSMATPQLDRSSIEDGALHEHDAEGQLVQVIGKQWDGTHTAAVVSGPPPPTPIGVTAEAVVGGLKVGWGGLWEDDAVAPMDYARTEIHVGTTAPEPGQEAMFASLRTTINTPRGGEVLIALPDGEYYAWLVARSQSGKASAASEIIGPISPAKIGIDDLGFDVSQFGGGTTIHYGPDDPSTDTDISLKTGDLWFREVAAGPPPEYETSRWVDGAWVLLQDQSIGEALAKAIAAEQAVATKAAIFPQPDDPSLDAAVTLAVGDFWMDSDDGNRLRSWDGAQWQDRQLGNGAIKPNSLVASDVIATGTVSASLFEAVLVLATDVIGGNPQGAHVVLNEDGLTGKRADGTITLDFDTETGDVRMIGELSTGYVGQPRVEIKRDAAGGEHRIAFHGINETPGVDRTRIYAFDLYSAEYDITVSSLALETFTEALWGRVWATHGAVGMRASTTIWDEEMQRHYPSQTLSLVEAYESAVWIEGKEFVRIGTSNIQPEAGAEGSTEGAMTEWFSPIMGHPLESEPRISSVIGIFQDDGIRVDEVEVLRQTAQYTVIGNNLEIPNGNLYLGTSGAENGHLWAEGSGTFMGDLTVMGDAEVYGFRAWGSAQFDAALNVKGGINASGGVNSLISVAGYTNATLGISYPSGMSLIYLSSANAASGGWPFAGKNGILITQRYSNATEQIWHRYAGSTAEPEMWIRHGDGSGWGPWRAVYEDTGWVNCTINSGYAMLNTDERPQVRRFNGKVYMRGAWGNTGITAGGTHTVGKIPAGFIPPLNVIGPIGTSSAASMSIGFISAGGDVQIRANSVLSAYYMFNPMEWFTN